MRSSDKKFPTAPVAGVLFNPRQSLRLQLILIAVVPLLLSIIVAWIVDQAMQEAVETEARVDQTIHAINVSDGLIISVLEAQTGMRGYAISGDKRFLTPYFRSVEAFDNLMVQGRELWAGNREQIEILDEIGQRFERYREEITEPVLEAHDRAEELESGDEPGPDEIAVHRAAIGSERGKALVDEMKVMLRDLKAQQQKSLDQQTALSERNRRNARMVGLAGAPVAVLIALSLLGGLLSRVSRGLDELAGAAMRVKEEDYSGQIELVDNRELAQVASGFNRMVETLAERERQSRAMGRLGRLLQACQSSEEAYELVESLLPQVLPDAVGTVYVYRASRDLVEPVAQWNLEAEGPVKHASFEPADCWALRSGYVHHRDAAEGGLPCKHFADADRIETACVPMNSGEEMLGMLAIESPIDGGLPEGTVMQAGIVAEALALTIANLQLREALRTQSIRDPLTGLYNRRFLDETLPREFARSERTDQPLSLIVLDADHFKRFNDNWGHDAGDAVLVAIARTLREQSRDMDIPCRLGGEEFLMVLPRTGGDDATLVAERIRAAMAALDVRHHGTPLDQITVSLGVATFPDVAREPGALIKAADNALYRAKAGGRNRVERAG